MSALATLPEDFDPSEPLTLCLDERYERLAQLAVIGVPKQTAAWEAGFRAKGDQPVRPGNVARYFRDPRVAARMTFLSGDDAEKIAATREFVRERLMNWATLDIGRYAIVKETEVDGKKVFEVTGLDLVALVRGEHSSAIKNLKFDRESGVLIEADRVEQDAAIAQLRDMYGLRAPRRTELTGKGGGPIETVDVTKYTDEELTQLEGILAAGESRTNAGVGPSGDRA